MLEIKNLSVHYGEEEVLKNINLQVKAGEVLVISGESGCGKSTIIKIINGIIPFFTNAQISGDIFYKDLNLMSLDIAERSAYISTVFQNPKTQFYTTKVLDEMAFALENQQLSRTSILDRIDEYTALLNTKKLMDRDLFKLSGGEKQMVAITSVACMNANIYIFDEPSSSLDKEAINDLKNAILKLKALGKIIIVAEHRLYYLKDIMDRLCIVKNKQLICFSHNEINDEVIRLYQLRTLHNIQKDALKKFSFIEKSIFDKKYDSTSNMQCKNYHFSYIKNQPVFDMNLSFKQDIYFLIGRNGVGKTTFVRSLCGLLKGFKGNTVYQQKQIKKAFKYISLVMQDVNYQLFTESVWQELSLASNDDDKKTEALSELGLLDKKEAHPQSLSGGEKQRLAIALCKVSKKPIVVLDEPTSGLCKKNMMKIINFIHTMQKDGKTIFIITHDYEFIIECGGIIVEFQ